MAINYKLYEYVIMNYKLYDCMTNINDYMTAIFDCIML